MGPRERARQAARAGGFVGITAAMMPPFFLRTKMTDDEGQRELRNRWLARWSGTLLSLFSIRLSVCGAVPPKSRERGRLVVSNHRSAIDIGILLNTVGGKMVARSDISGWPVLGKAASLVGTIFVDRKNTQSGVAAIRTMEAELERGETINIFPEGTTFVGDEIRPFHRGGFVAARAAHSEILPIALAYEAGSPAAFFNETFMQHLSRMSAAGKPTRVALAIGEPFIATETSAALARRAQEEVARLVKIARARIS